MGSSSPTILEISSDEEFDFGIARISGDGGGGGEIGGRADCLDWLSEVLGEVGGDKNVDENDDASDDVVVVSEVLPKKKLGAEGLKPVNKETLDRKVDVGEDDDDCVILDGDPIKPVAVVKEKVDSKAVGFNADDDDDLQIVSEKGEVACRDFPHPRHLCAKFPFDSTSHEVHCAQCHCYVCDSLAPCSKWGTGKASVDHCHASDVFKHWKTERKNMKQGIHSASLPSQTVGPFAQNHFTRPAIIRPCSGRSANYNIPTNNVFSRPTTNSPRPVMPRFRPQPQSAFPQMQHTAHNTNVASSGQGLNVGSPIASSFAPRVSFKRIGAPANLPTNKRANTSQISANMSATAHQMHQIHFLRDALASNGKNVSSHTARPMSPQLRFPAPQNVPSVKNTVCRPQLVNPQPYPNGLLRDSRQTQARGPFEPFITSQSPQGLASRPIVGGGLQNVNLARPVYPNQHVSPAPRIHSGSLYRPTAQYASGYNSISHALNGINSSPNGVGFSQNFSVGSTSVRSQVLETEVTLQGDSSGIHSTVEDVNLQQQQQTVGLVDSSSLNPTDACLSPPEIAKHDSLDLDLNGWMLGSNSSSEEAFAVPLSPVWNVFSPEPASLGTDAPFDY